MNAKKLPKMEVEQYDPNLETQDEDVLSGSSNRLMYILVALIVALVLGYVALPKGQGSVITSVTPSFLLDDAAVVAARPTTGENQATDTENAPTEELGDDAGKEAAKSTNKTAKAAAATPAVSAASVVAAPTSAAAPEALPASAQATAAAAPAAPATVTMTGKIDDENGHPLVGATVLLKGSSKGTSTDANGNYTLEVPSGDNTLIYGYGGYDDEEVRSNGARPVNVTLTPRAKSDRRRR